MKVNIDRIEKDMDFITSISASPGKGCTRLSFSKEDEKVRKYIISELEKIGANIKIDGLGNIRARINDKAQSPSIMIGSHIDTVPSGGKFDGLTGVISSLEVLRILYENSVKTELPVELIIFSEEEGSNFGVTTLSSKIITGLKEPSVLKNLYNDAGQSAYDYIKSKGYKVDNIEKDLIKKEEVAAMIELHVEQGAVLDTEKIPVGIVTAISGMNTYKVKIEGASNHAGTTPMNLRQDPLCGAAEVILDLEDFAKTKANPTTVATVGKLECSPSASNVINKTVNFNVDIRDVEKSGITKTSEELISALEEIGARRNLKISYELIGSSEPVELSKKIIGLIEEKAKDKGIKHKLMHSGAVHDAMMMESLTDVGMIFVPSHGGISHSPYEDTSFEDIEMGANLLLDAVADLAKVGE